MWEKIQNENIHVRKNEWQYLLKYERNYIHHDRFENEKARKLRMKIKSPIKWIVGKWNNEWWKRQRHQVFAVSMYDAVSDFGASQWNEQLLFFSLCLSSFSFIIMIIIVLFINQLEASHEMWLPILSFMLCASQTQRLGKNNKYVT